ncbi:gamma-glutamyltransferase family protein [Oceanimonas baumannii]|uniref:gamma-glutamyltransferase family protein n=1 Tax=Oceanimonas baumannii TaxID=129578 RepID=UPI001D1845EB|nr:gamma-glutamyltransferase family protein [Oceanimonas baumannii]MCC4263424.1 gamma-glutamyltransferase family protein [Oceanimonas baumannii]
MHHDLLHYPHSSRRTITCGRRGMVATSQTLAAQVGLDILKQGGNAIDAAIATAATLTVVEPTSNGIGGDAFALVWTKSHLYGLNASGPSPQAMTMEAIRSRGHQEIPLHGWLPVTVPGAPAAWAALSRRFGRLPFKQLLIPAIDIARDGFAVTPTVQQLWQAAASRYRKDKDGLFRPWFDTFCPAGSPPDVGALWRSKDHAHTLQAIADSDARDFYEGDLAARMEQHALDQGGLLRRSDLASFQPEWVDPIHVNYRGYDIWELPPNGSGMIALMALNILKELEPAKDAAARLHQRIEATKLAYADGLHYLTEPGNMQVSPEQLLSPEYARARSHQIGTRAILPAPGQPAQGGTVYLATADEEGNMVSFIQSNFHGFGSGIVVPGTGISLQNRGSGFSLNPGHVNCLQPGKRPYHTIIPGFITHQGHAVGPFGMMGGYMQPQGHVQLITGMLDDGLNPQAVLDAPRWKWTSARHVEVEAGFPPQLLESLQQQGHKATINADSLTFGRGQIILRDTTHGTLLAGTEPRADGTAAAW